MHDTGFIQDLAIVLGVAAATGLLFQLVRQPSVLGYLLAGLIVGPYIPIPLFADPERVHNLSEFGVVLVMFAVGLEFRLAKFLDVLPVSGVTAAVEIGALFGVGALLGSWLGWSPTQSLFLGACLCVSSTMAVSKILEQRPIPPDSRTFVFGVLVLQDVAAIALIAIMTAIGQGSGASFSGVLAILGKLLAVLLALVAAGMFVVPRLVRVLIKTKSAETLVVGAVGLCFSLALFAEQLGYSAALGAFIAGVLVAESGNGQKVEHATAAVRDVFAAVFFVSIGMTVDPFVAVAHLPTALLVLAAVVLTQFVSVTLGGMLSGSGIRRSVTAGLSLGQIGEFAFIIAAIGVSAGVVTPEFQPILVTVAVLSTFTTALGLRQRELVTRWVDRAVPKRLHDLLAIYEEWFDEIRSAPSEAGQGVGTAIRQILLDLALMTALVLAWKIWRGSIATYLADTFTLDASLSQTISALLLGCALLPLLVPLALIARKLSVLLADKVFKGERGSARATLRAALLLLILACVSVPVTLLIGGIVGVKYIWFAFALALAAAAAVTWRRVRALDEDLRSGGAMVLSAIARQGMPDAPRDSHVSSMGLTKVHEVTLSEAAYAFGKTLAQLQLRSLTGASVVGVRGQEGAMRHPSAEDALGAGDTLFIAGCRADQEAAEEYLMRGAATPRS